MSWKCSREGEAGTVHVGLLVTRRARGEKSRFRGGLTAALALFLVVQSCRGGSPETTEAGETTTTVGPEEKAAAVEKWHEAAETQQGYAGSMALVAGAAAVMSVPGGFIAGAAVLKAAMTAALYSMWVWTKEFDPPVETRIFAQQEGPPIIEDVVAADTRESVAEKPVPPGTLVRLIGSGFAVEPEENTVILGDQVLPSIPLPESSTDVAGSELLTIMGLPGLDLPQTVELRVFVNDLESEAFELVVAELLEPPERPEDLFLRFANLEAQLARRYLQMDCGLIADTRFVPEGHNLLLTDCFELQATSEELIFVFEEGFPAYVEELNEDALDVFGSLLAPLARRLDLMEDVLIPAFGDRDSDGIPNFWEARP